MGPWSLVPSLHAGTASPSNRPPAARRWITNAAFALLLVYTWSQGRSVAEHAATHGADSAPGWNGVRFREVAGASGISFRHQPTRVDPKVANLAPHLIAVGAAVSVVDADVDGLPDLYAVTSADHQPNALWRNQGDGSFEDVAARAGVADLNRDGHGASMGSTWADIDNDGDPDAYLYKWGHPQLLRNDLGAGGELAFTDITEVAGVDRWMSSHGATFLDRDLDGDLDLYVTGYFPEEHDLWDLKSTRIMHDSFEFSHNGGKNYLYDGDGRGGFVDVTDAAGLDSTLWTYAVVAADFDRDGWPDLYVANDYGPEELLRNRDGRTFARVDGIGLEKESKSGMCVTLGDVSNEARPAVYVTNISKAGYLFQGNNLRVSELDEGRGMEQIAKGQVADCGWAWGAQFGDLDNNGYQDLVVVNGFISASKERDYWYQMSKIGLANEAVIVDAAKWPPLDDRSLSGYERTRVLLNLTGDESSFVEVGLRVGVSDLNDGRAVARLDLDDDGLLDLVVANQNGPLLLYRNETDNHAAWVGFRLQGTQSNRDALGAEVIVTFREGRQLQIVTAACGFSSQNDRRLHFGLGKDPGDFQVHVRWPSGITQDLSGLAPGQYHTLMEPAR